MDELQALESLGLTLPTPAYLAGAFLFGVIGMFAFYYARKTTRTTLKWLGVALMLYPYIVSNTWLLYLVGVALCCACYYYRNQ